MTGLPIFAVSSLMGCDSLSLCSVKENVSLSCTADSSSILSTRKLPPVSPSLPSPHPHSPSLLSPHPVTSSTPLPGNSEKIKWRSPLPPSQSPASSTCLRSVISRLRTFRYNAKGYNLRISYLTQSPPGTLEVCRILPPWGPSPLHYQLGGRVIRAVSGVRQSWMTLWRSRVWSQPLMTQW